MIFICDPEKGTYFTGLVVVRLALTKSNTKRSLLSRTHRSLGSSSETSVVTSNGFSTLERKPGLDTDLFTHL